MYKQTQKPKLNQYRYYGNNASYNYQTRKPVHSQIKPHKKRKSFRSLWSLIVVLAIILVSILGFRNHTIAKEVNSTVGFRIDTNTLPIPASNINQKNFSYVSKAVNQVISSNPQVTFEVATDDLDDGSQLNFGQSTSTPMLAGSTSKVLTAVDFLNQTENGDESLSETLEDGNIASSDIQSMIVVSNDTSWQSLNDELSYDQISDYAESIGANSYIANSNSLSARDMTDIMGKLYDGKLLDQDNTNTLLSYLKQANYRNYILPAVPNTDTVYHKIGLFNDSVNDTAIITNGRQSIALTIYTNGNGTYNWQERATMMQDITKPILVYYGLS